jgi:hypothetical protein
MSSEFIVTGGKRQQDVRVIDTTSLVVRIDEASSTLSYLGKAPVGSATSDGKWQIAKLDTTSGLIITYANGSSEFNSIWDDRASLNYS